MIILALVGGMAFYFFRVKGSTSNNSKKRGFDDDEDFDEDDTVNEDDIIKSFTMTLDA